MSAHYRCRFRLTANCAVAFTVRRIKEAGKVLRRVCVLSLARGAGGVVGYRRYGALMKYVSPHAAVGRV
ncbi:MAG: hypothetical protein ACR2G4_06960 [Pyrinomonadaceae bacterium]